MICGEGSLPAWFSPRPQFMRVCAPPLSGNSTGAGVYNKGPRGLTRYMPIAIDQPFAARMAHDVAAKPGIEREHQAVLDERYDLGDHPAQGVTLERGKPPQE